MKVTMDL